jgi:hypothetical protein
MGIEASTIEHKFIDCGSNSHLAAGLSRLKAVQPEKGTEAKEGLQPVIISDEVRNIRLHVKRTRGGVRRSMEGGSHPKADEGQLGIRRFIETSATRRASCGAPQGQIKYQSVESKKSKPPRKEGRCARWEGKKAQTVQRYSDEQRAPRGWAARAHALWPNRFNGGIFLTVSLYSPIVVFYSLQDDCGSVAWLPLRVQEN